MATEMSISVALYAPATYVLHKPKGTSPVYVAMAVLSQHRYFV